MAHEDATRSDAGRFHLEWPSVVAMVLAPIGVVIASFAIPSGVDELPTSDHRARDVLARVAAHPFSTRLGFLSFAAGMLLLIPALAALRAVVGAGDPGRVLLGVGTRLCAVGAAAGAIGNSFAPATLPSMIHGDLPREVMVHFWRHHALNGWDWVIIAFYPLITIGGALIGVGLWRSGRVSRTTALLVSIPLFVLIAPPLSPPTAVLGFALEAGFLLVLRGRRPVRPAALPLLMRNRAGAGPGLRREG